MASSTNIAKSIPLEPLLDQLNTEFNETLKQLIPKVSDDSEYNERILNDELQSKGNDFFEFFKSYQILY